jgi:serine/threonine protein kinase
MIPGTQSNHYRIVRRLGAGGMGEVYEAEDTKLKRRVAVKILPAAAALNHPNIVTIHSVEEAGSTRFLTMEFVDGSTIAQLMPPAGFPLPILLGDALSEVRHSTIRIR